MKSFKVQAHRDGNKIIGYTVATYDKDTGKFLAISDFTFATHDKDMRCCAAERDEQRRNADRKKEEMF